MAKNNILQIGDKIDPFEFSKKRYHLENSLDLDKMLRLKTITHGDQKLGEVRFWIDGDIDAQGVYYLRGSIKAVIPLTCQRCLELLEYPLTGEFLLSAVRTDEEASRLPTDYDPLYLSSDQTFSLLEMIEDELILDLPIVPKHDERDCRVRNLNF